MNKHSKHKPALRRQKPLPGGGVLPFLGACLATLMALPVNSAVMWPDAPLQSAPPVPPNILFITDNSASMTLVSMPYGAKDWEYDDAAYKDQRDGGGATDVGLWDEPYNRSYLNNTIYYDPKVTYEPWIKADGTRYTDGTSITQVIGDWNQVAQPFSDTNDSTNAMYRNLVNDDEAIFYVPHTGVSKLPGNNKSTYHDPTATDGDINTINNSDYDRYVVFDNGSGPQVMRTGAPNVLASLDPGLRNIASKAWWRGNITVPAGTTTLRVTIQKGKGGGDADLYLKFGADPTTVSYDYRNWDTNNDQQITLLNPKPGTWHIGVYNKDGADPVTKEQIEALALNDGLTAATPTGRSNADELTNIANWYSYYRTRLKTAKGGASEAFATVGAGNRVAYVPLNKSNRATRLATGKVIPVDKNKGRFEDVGSALNKTDWYKAVQEEVVPESTTPLRIALDQVGKYYSRTDIDGPWSDGTADQHLDCRQSVSILTTDGYWTDDNQGSSYPYYTEDGKAGVITDVDGDGSTESDGGPDTTLADIAMHYYKTDLRPDLANNLTPTADDPAKWQHMTTFSISIGAQGTMAITDPAPDNTPGNWTNPLTTNGAVRIDDLWHAAVNGHGTFTVASSPTEFAQALIDALAAVAGRAGSNSNISTNSLSFQTGSAVYQASYTPGIWSGELQAFSTAGGVINATPLWSASSLIPAYGSRNILTWNGSAGASFPTTGQETALARSTGLAVVTGANNANYLKGDPSLEIRNSGKLRNRSTTVLGDIANSSPLYLEEGVTNRKHLFVGANDGMLHTFNAATGVEQFAYVPAGLNFSGTNGLGALSDPQYIHSWFVDGPLVATTQDKTPGANYLVGALGRGGKGLFGLDITNPAAFSTANVLWDNTGSAAPTNMGQVLGEPLIVKMNDGTTAIIASNGINSSSETASLFILNLTTGAIIKELDTGVTGGNGLSAPRGWDSDGNGTVDYVFAGDLKGNLWKFDLTATSKTNWVIDNSGSPMFVATDASDNPQPITSGLALAKDPVTMNLWVFFGTGKFLETTDVTDMSVQSMYGVIDGGVVAGRTSGGDGDLQKREIIEIDGTDHYRGFEAHSTLTATMKGWYIDLLTPPSPGTAEGERIVVRPQVIGTVLITASMIPPANDGTCDAFGSGYINALDAFTGTSTSQPYFDANGDGDFTNDTIGSPPVPIGSIDLGVGMPTMPVIIDDLLVVSGSDATLGKVKVNPQGMEPRRITWHEILRD